MRICGHLGHDELSYVRRRGLAEADVNARHLVDEAGAGPCYSIIIVDDTSKSRNIFFDLSSLRPWPVDQVTPVFIGSARVLFIDQFGMDAKLAAAGLARRIGVPVVADMEWAELPKTDDLMAMVDHLLVPLHFVTDRCA